MFTMFNEHQKLANDSVGKSLLILFDHDEETNESENLIVLFESKEDVLAAMVISAFEKEEEKNRYLLKFKIFMKEIKMISEIKSLEFVNTKKSCLQRFIKQWTSLHYENKVVYTSNKSRLSKLKKADDTMFYIDVESGRTRRPKNKKEG